MNKTIKLGTRINETVEQVEQALESIGSATLIASGNAISKAITIAEIVKRNSRQPLKQLNRLSKSPVQVAKAVVSAALGEEEEEGEWKAVPAADYSEKFTPRLEIHLNLHERG